MLDLCEGRHGADVQAVGLKTDLLQFLDPGQVYDRIHIDLPLVQLNRKVRTAGQRLDAPAGIHGRQSLGERHRLFISFDSQNTHISFFFASYFCSISLPCADLFFIGRFIRFPGILFGASDHLF